MIERVLVPTNFSRATDRALEWAVRQFPQALVKLFHVAQPQDPSVGSTMTGQKGDD